MRWAQRAQRTQGHDERSGRGGRYKALILWHLGDGCLRFGELGRRIPRATPKMLTQQLRELEADGLVSRTVYPVVPPKTEYALTPFGETFKPVLSSMCDWGRSYLEKAQDDDANAPHEPSEAVSDAASHA